MVYFQELLMFLSAIQCLMSNLTYFLQVLKHNIHTVLAHFLAHTPVNERVPLLEHRRTGSLL